MANDDQFFEEEADLARKEVSSKAQVQGKGVKKTPDASTGQPATRAGGAKPPSFALVVAIALVALVLGICLGYFFAMTVVDRTSTTTTQVAQVSQATSASSTTEVAATADGTSAATDASSDADATSLPAGHPDLASLMNEDGTVNEEALAEYKAQLVAQKDSSADAQATDTDAADTAADSGETAGTSTDAASTKSN